MLTLLDSFVLGIVSRRGEKKGERKAEEKKGKVLPCNRNAIQSVAILTFFLAPPPPPTLR